MPIETPKTNWADDVDEEFAKAEDKLPPPQVIGPDKNGIKKVIEYKLNDAGKRIKITKTFRLETRSAKHSTAVIERKKWKKFGASEGLKAGPDPASTSIGEEVFLTLTTKSKELDTPVEGSELTKKLAGHKMVQCRICKGEHWTTKCPLKDVLPMPAEDEDRPTEKAAPATPSSAGGSKYVPPSMRDGGNKRGESMNRGGRGGEGEDQATIRVTNLSEDTRESDLQELFRPFGPI
eukprot:Opistho-2@51699